MQLIDAVGTDEIRFISTSSGFAQLRRIAEVVANIYVASSVRRMQRAVRETLANTDDMPHC